MQGSRALALAISSNRVSVVIMIHSSIPIFLVVSKGNTIYILCGRSFSTVEFNVMSDDDEMRNEDSSSNDESESDESSSNGPLPLPRDHSYLVAAHPLVVNDNQSTRKLAFHNKNNNNDPFFDLAVLELFGVVLFPGSTIPVKLRDRSLIEYLGKQIEVCRECPHLQSEVRLGILTYNHSDLDQRRSRSRDDFLIGRIGVSFFLFLFVCLCTRWNCTVF